MGINNPFVREHMIALFGEDKYNKLKRKAEEKSPKEREMVIIEELCQALKEDGSRFILPFRFKDKQGKRTSHHLIFISKSFRGYEIMKEIMAKESSSDDEGVPSLEYNPADLLPKQSLLFEFSKPLEDLKGELMDKFKGRRVKMKDIYLEHSVGTPYVKKNYKTVLKELLKDGSIDAISEKGKPPRSGTFGDDIIVTFK